MSEKELKWLLDAILTSVGKSMPEHLFSEAYEFVRNGSIEADRHTDKEDSVLSLITEWGGIDGGHHKQWLLDQIVRALTGDRYDKWISDYELGDSGPETYKWDEGIAP